ncbi:MAG: 4a-hydroxytetrahydrobiopterin dehydratase [Planctomycetes bacterium]|nr:4a-hydroxytetrahydrobiopterin dehydratase [Planctomycetota bacterium]
MNEPLADRECIPCQGGVAPLSAEAVDRFLGDLNGVTPSWEARDGHHITKAWSFPDFKSALAFTNAVGAESEDQGHHPDIHLAWGRVSIDIWTHKIDGLTESDFVLAARVDRIAERMRS